MADVKISQLPAATTPVDGTEVLPIVQSATTKQVSIANLTAGRAMAASSLTLTTPLAVTSGGTGLATVAQGALLSATAADTISATRTPTLGLAGTAAGTLGLSGSTSGVVTLQTAAAAGTWSMTLPTSGGTNGYILTTNGAGVTTWTNPTALGIDLDVGTTAITGGTTGRVLYDNAGVLGEYSSVPVSFGGTGLTSLTAGYIPYGNGTGAFSSGALIVDNGNLGLGVSPSAWLSSWKSFDVASGGASLYGGLAIAGITNNAYLDSGVAWRYKASYGAARYDISSSGAHAWYQAASGTAGSAISFTQAMTLDASGNLGIGSTTPTGARLYVSGGSLFTGAPGSYGLGISGSLTTGRIGTYDATTAAVLNTYYDNSSIELSAGVTSGYACGISITSRSATNYANTVRFVTTGTEAARIDGSGRLLVATTGTLGFGEKLGVAGVIATTGAQMNMQPGQDFEFVQRSAYKMNFYVNTASVMATLSITGVWTNASDARIKSNIRDIDYGLSTVLNTQPRSFFKTGSDKSQIGFIAQELEEIIPDVVYGGGDEQYTVDYGSLTAVAFKAIQELAAKVSALEAKQ